MMGHIYVLFALFGGLLKGFTSKKLSNDVKTFGDSVFMNFIRMLFCVAIGFTFIGLSGDFGAVGLNVSDLWVYLFSAVSLAGFLVSYLFAFKVSAYMYTNTFTMLGSFLTCLLEAIIYNTEIRFNKWLGMIILLAAVYIMSQYNRDINNKMSLKGLFVLIFTAVCSALTDFSQKVFQKEIGLSANIFNLYTYLFTAAILLIVLLGLFVVNKNEKTEKTKKYGFKHIFACFIIAVGLYINTYSKTFAAATLSTAEIYPVLQGANLIASAVLAHILLKEKINRKSIAGMMLAFIGLVVMNVF